MLGSVNQNGLRLSEGLKASGQTQTNTDATVVVDLDRWR